MLLERAQRVKAACLWACCPCTDAAVTCGASDPLSRVLKCHDISVTVLKALKILKLEALCQERSWLMCSGITGELQGNLEMLIVNVWLMLPVQ